MENYGRVRQATDGNIIRRIYFIRWTNTATETLSEFAISPTYRFSKVITLPYT